MKRVSKCIVVLLLCTIAFIGCTEQEDVKVETNEVEPGVIEKPAEEIAEKAPEEDNTELATIDKSISEDGLYVITSDLCVIGGYKDNKWIMPEDFVDQLNGGEEYGVYTLDKRLENSIGSKPIAHDAPHLFYEIEMENKESVDFFVAESEDYYDSFYKNIYYRGQATPMPRTAQVLDNDNDTYKKVVKDLLAENEVVAEDITIRQLLKVDIEGDGVDEVIITASNITDNLSSDIKNPSYSLVILRKIVDGEVKNILLEDYIYNKNNPDNDFIIANTFLVTSLLDLNGDGRLEIIVEGRYHEGIWFDIYDIENDKASPVLTNGVGA